MPMAFPDGHVYSREVSNPILMSSNVPQARTRHLRRWQEGMGDWLHAHDLVVSASYLRSERFSSLNQYCSSMSIWLVRTLNKQKTAR